MSQVPEYIQKAIHGLNTYLAKRDAGYVQAQCRGDFGLAEVLRADFLAGHEVCYKLLINHEFDAAVAAIMEWDTEARDAALEEFKAEGLQDAVEATGLVTYV